MFYKVSIRLTPQSDKDMSRKHYYRPICLMNIDTEILIKILGNCIQQYIKRMLYNNELDGVYPGMQDWFNIPKSMDVINHYIGISKIIKLIKKRHLQNLTPVHCRNS